MSFVTRMYFFGARGPQGVYIYIYTHIRANVHVLYFLFVYLFIRLFLFIRRDANICQFRIRFSESYQKIEDSDSLE